MIGILSSKRMCIMKLMQPESAALLPLCFLQRIAIHCISWAAPESLTGAYLLPKRIKINRRGMR